MKPLFATLGCLLATVALGLAVGPQHPPAAATPASPPLGLWINVCLEGPDAGTWGYANEGWAFYRFPDEAGGRPYSQHIRWNEQGRVWTLVQAPECGVRIEMWFKGSRWLTAPVSEAVVGCEGQPELTLELAKVGDAVPDNRVDIRDFNTLKAGFGHECGDELYSYGADATGDCFITVTDWWWLLHNFGEVGVYPPSPPF